MDESSGQGNGRSFQRRRVPPQHTLRMGHGIKILQETAGGETTREPERKLWQKPRPLAYGESIELVATVASPLLAGFSLASVTMIANESEHFRWPGYAILALTVAASSLIGAMHAGFAARQYLWSADWAAEWWPEMEKDQVIKEHLRNQQNADYEKWQSRVHLIRIFYHFGIIALLSGLALVLPPLGGTGVQETLRWIATCLAVIGVLVEMIDISILLGIFPGTARRRGELYVVVNSPCRKVGRRLER